MKVALHDPFPEGDMGPGNSNYSGSALAGSEASDENHEDFHHKDGKDLRPENVFRLAIVELSKGSGEASGKDGT
jgi:hypothetical protein